MLASGAHSFVVQLTVAVPVGGLTPPRARVAETVASKYGFTTQVGVQGAPGWAWSKGASTVMVLPDQFVLVSPTEPGRAPDFPMMAGTSSSDALGPEQAHGVGV